MDHISGTTPGETPSQAHDSGEPQRPDAGSPPPSQSTADAAAAPGVNDAGPGPSAAGAAGAAPSGGAGAAAPGAAHAPAAEGAPQGTAAPAEPAQKGAGFRSRGRMRRRARFLRKARELAYRDLGGLVFNLHRFGQRNDALVLAKLNLIGQMDSELRTLEAALRDRRPITVLREAGITACARCAAIHSSEDRFCPNCGLAMGRHADLPVGGTQAAGAGTTGAGGQPGAPQPAARAGEATAQPPAQPQPAQAAPQPAGGPAPEQATPAGPPTQVLPGPAGPAPRTQPGPAGSPGSRGRSPSPPSFDATQAFPRVPEESPRADPAPARGGDAAPPAGEDTEILRPSQGP